MFFEIEVVVFPASILSLKSEIETLSLSVFVFFITALSVISLLFIVLIKKKLSDG